MIAAIREEIFEIALGRAHKTPVDTLMYVMEVGGIFVVGFLSFASTDIRCNRGLKADQAQLISKLPPCLIYRPGDLANLNLSDQILYSRLMVELELLQNTFFIERLLIRHGQKDTGDLLVASFYMVT